MDKTKLLDSIRILVHGLQYDYTNAKASFDHNTQTMLDNGIGEAIDDTCIALLRLVESA